MTGQGRAAAGAAHPPYFPTTLLSSPLSSRARATRRESLDTEARVSIGQEGTGWAIKAVALSLRADRAGVRPRRVQKLAHGAEATCPASRALKADIMLDAELG